MNSIKKEVEEALGRNVVVKADKGRKRIVTKEGVLEGAFADVFPVRVTNNFDVESTVSYTYTDVLTGTVKMTIY